MGKTIFDTISNEGRSTLFGLPASEELEGRTALLPEGTKVSLAGALALKCDDDLFLAQAGDRLLLAEELSDGTLKALDTEKAAAEATALPEALEGWETDLCFASGYVLTALFQDGTLTLRPSPEPANPFAAEAAAAPEAPAAPLGVFPLQAVETGDKRFLLRFPETGEILFLNARRFLLYAILRGRIVCGFVEIPARE